jgi:O-antigen/teichoic acid export membrane protein
MESVRKQSIQTSVINFTGSFVGALSTIFLYPLDLNLYGIYGFLTNTASLLVPFISLGFGAVLWRFFPYFNDPKKKHRGFFGFIISAYGTGILLFTLLFVLFFPWIFSFFTNGHAESGWYVYYVLPITILYVVFDLFTNFSVNFQRITVPAITVFFMKLFLPAIFILSVRNFISQLNFVQLICLYYVVVILLLIYYLKYIGKLKIRFSKDVFCHPMKRQMFRFAVFSLLSGTSAVLALRIDSIFITSMNGTEANGLFTLAIFISNVAFIPAMALSDSLNPVIASFSKTREQGKLQDMYSKSSVHMLIPTLWISACIYAGFLSLSQIMPNPEKVAGIHMVIAWLLLARIIDAGTGINHYILSYSKFYPIELYLLTLMAILNIGCNLWFIPEYGIHGAAFATFLSVSIYNILKTILVYSKLKIHPFSKSIAVISICGLFIAILLCLGISIVYFGLIYSLKLSPEMNQLIRNFICKIQSLIKS